MGISNGINEISNTTIIGPQGESGSTGIGIQSITFEDLDNGMVEMNFNMSDASNYQITNSVLSDALIALDRITLSGSNNAEKINVKNDINGN